MFGSKEFYLLSRLKKLIFFRDWDGNRFFGVLEHQIKVMVDELPPKCQSCSKTITIERNLPVQLSNFIAYNSRVLSSNHF